MITNGMLVTVSFESEARLSKAMVHRNESEQAGENGARLLTAVPVITGALPGTKLDI